MEALSLALWLWGTCLKPVFLPWLRILPGQVPSGCHTGFPSNLSSCLSLLRLSVPHTHEGNCEYAMILHLNSVHLKHTLHIWRDSAPPPTLLIWGSGVTRWLNFCLIHMDSFCKLRASALKESASQCRKCRGCGLYPWTGKIPWRRKCQPTLVFLPGVAHGKRSLAGYSPGSLKESNMS